MLALALFGGFAFPQSQAINGEMARERPAGGQWQFQVSSDAMTDAQYSVFTLKAEAEIGDGISEGFPEFIIMCGGSATKPRWINSKLLSPVVLGTPDDHSIGGVPQQSVVLRADGKFHAHFWNIGDDFKTLFVDRGATEELVLAKDARIQFRGADGLADVARFAPEGLNLRILGIACGKLIKAKQ